MATLAEERVLQPLDPVPDDVNDWPDFALAEVKIFHQGKGRYADLLEASEEDPLCVLGELVSLDDDQQDLALIEDPEGARIRIDNVTNYSFGQDDSGRPVVWAAGRAGWYEINPSDRYHTHYNDTIEAIDLFYFMVDQHQKLGKKRQKRGFMIDPFLTEYQKHTDYRIDDDDEAMETIHKHHKFLLKQMVEEREGIDWSQTHLWKHLAETYTQQVESLKNAHERLQNGVEAAEAASRAAIDQNEESCHGDESSEESDAASEEVEEDTRDWTKVIWNLLNVLRKNPNFNLRHCGIDELATELESDAHFDGSHRAAVSAIERAAEPLLRLMNLAKLRKKFNWQRQPIYTELEATLADEIAADIKTPAKKPQDKRHRQKSVLRPSGAGKANKRTRAAEVLEDDHIVHEAPASASMNSRRLPQRSARANTVDTAFSLEDSPSRQLNGHIDALPELPPPPEAQEMLELVAKEAKMVGRQHQTSHLEAFLGQWVL